VPKLEASASAEFLFELKIVSYYSLDFLDICDVTLFVTLFLLCLLHYDGPSRDASLDRTK
jgi:hypothetical protein